MEFGLTLAISSYAKDALMVLGLLAFCASLDGRLFLAGIAAVPVSVLPLAAFARRLKRVSDQCQRALGALASQAGEAIENVRVVQAFCREEGELGRVDLAQGRFLERMRVSFLLRAAFSPSVEMVAVLGLAATIAFAGRAIAHHTLRGETLLSFLAALMMMYRPLKELATTGQLVVQSISSGRRLFEVLDATERLPEPEEAPPASFERELAMRDLTFAYGERPVLEGVRLRLPKGRTLAMVGASGSGKSTLAALLLRFWDPQQGAVEFDGRDARSMRLRDLRRLIAFVPQEPVLFAGTVRDNVGCAREGASDAEVRAALEAAHAWDFVSELPGGLDGVIGEKGAGLSGGQRQRIAIARALLTDAPIILLDEATSALDSASEALVQKGLERLLQRRTALVIAHRLSTVERADEIAVLARGRVIEQGTHAGLLARKGAYAALWEAQAGEALATRAVG